jgi:hypothetical protein
VKRKFRPFRFEIRRSGPLFWQVGNLDAAYRILDKLGSPPKLPPLKIID